MMELQQNNTKKYNLLSSFYKSFWHDSCSRWLSPAVHETVLQYFTLTSQFSCWKSINKKKENQSEQ